MSRIGKKEITVPQGTEVVVSDGAITVTGSAGVLTRALPLSITVEVNDGTVKVNPVEDSLESRALWGTYASHIINMIKGVNAPFEKKLEIQGIGYKVENKGDKLVFALGFSHPVEVNIPSGIKVLIEKNILTLTSTDKERLGEFASRLRAMKRPEPYKGKGIRYFGEVVKIKQGKKSV